MKYLESERLAGNRYRRHKCEVCNSCVKMCVKYLYSKPFTSKAILQPRNRFLFTNRNSIT